MREAMSALAREVIASHEARATGFAFIRQDVSAHRERARRQVQDLEGTRRVTSRTLHSHLARGRADLRAGVGAQIRELDQAHNAMAQQQREDLAKGHAGLRAGVATQLRELNRTHNGMAQQQREDLAEGHAELRASVGAQLRELNQAHNAMAQQQREDLAEGHAGLRASVGAQLRELDQAHNAMAQQQRDDLAQATAQRRSEVLGWMGELTADRLAAGQEWDHIAAALRRPRGVIAPKTPPAPPVGGVAEGSAALRDRVFAYLADHPDGVRFMDIEHQFRLDSQEASSVLRSLVEDGKAKRAGRLYLAT